MNMGWGRSYAKETFDFVENDEQAKGSDNLYILEGVDLEFYIYAEEFSRQHCSQPGLIGRSLPCG